MVDIGNRRLNLRCEGDDRTGPTILLESGLAFSSIGWRDAQPLLAKLARTCAYDRAGLGFSDTGPVPRDATALTDDLERLVDASGMKPPFLLVGNSMGSQIIRLFALRRPDQIRGVVLLDPYVEGENKRLAEIEPLLAEEAEALRKLDKRCIADFRGGELTADQAERDGCIASPPPGASKALRHLLRQQRISKMGFEAAYAETVAFETVNDTILARNNPTLGDIPLVVLSARRNFAETSYVKRRAELLKAQFALHQSIAMRSTRGSVQWADADHVIQTSNPAIVADVVSALLQTIRSQR